MIDDWFFIVLPVWAMVLAVKAAMSLRSGKPYRFRRWDGGAMMSSKYLSKKVVQVQLAAMVLLSAYALALWAGAMNFDEAKWICVGLLGVAMILQFGFAKTEPPDQERFRGRKLAKLSRVES